MWSIDRNIWKIDFFGVFFYNFMLEGGYMILFFFYFSFIFIKTKNILCYFFNTLVVFVIVSCLIRLHQICVK